MANPQEPELRRSGNIPALNPDATEAVRQADRPVEATESHGKVPPEQQPGNRPERDQDKPDPEAFAEALGIRSDDEEATEEAETTPRLSDRPLWQQPLALGVAGAGVAVGVVRALRRRRRSRS